MKNTYKNQVVKNSLPEHFQIGTFALIFNYGVFLPLIWRCEFLEKKAKPRI